MIWIWDELHEDSLIWVAMCCFFIGKKKDHEYDIQHLTKSRFPCALRINTKTKKKKVDSHLLYAFLVDYWHLIGSLALFLWCCICSYPSFLPGYASLMPGRTVGILQMIIVYFVVILAMRWMMMFFQKHFHDFPPSIWLK